MRIIRNTIGLLVLGFAFTFTNHLNAQKIAALNSDALIASMPETKAIENKLKAKSDEYQKIIDKKLQALQLKAKSYQEQASTQSEQINQSRGQELQKLEVEIQQAQQKYSQELQKYQNDLMSPVLEKVQNAIDKVARQGGYIAVFKDVTMLYFNGDDIGEAVKKELGI